MTNNEESIWYLSLDGDQQGPYTAPDIVSWLQDGRITPQTSCWREGMADWLAIEDTPDFRSFSAAAAGLPKLSAKVKRRLRLFALGIPVIILLCGGAVVLYYALNLHIPATVRGAMSLYNSGKYAEAYRVLDEYIENNRRLVRDLEELKRTQSPAVFRAQARKLLHPQAPFLMGQLMAAHWPKVVAGMAAAGRKVLESERNPETVFGLAIEIDPSYERKVAAFLSDTIAQRLDMGFEEMVQELAGQARGFIDARTYNRAHAMLEGFASSSSSSRRRTYDPTSELIVLLQKYDRDLGAQRQRQYEEYLKTTFPDEVRKQAVKKTVEQLLPELAQSLEGFPESELQQMIETGYRKELAGRFQAVVELLGNVVTGQTLEPPAERVFLALLKVCNAYFEAAQENPGLFTSGEWDPLVQLATLKPERFLPPLVKLVEHSSDLSMSLMAHTQAAKPSSRDLRPFSETDSRVICKAITQQLVRLCLAHAEERDTTPFRSFSKTMWPSTEVEKVCDQFIRHGDNVLHDDAPYFAMAYIGNELERRGGLTLASYMETFPTGQYLDDAKKAEKHTRIVVASRPTPGSQTIPEVQSEAAIAAARRAAEAQEAAEAQRKEEERLRTVEVAVRKLCQEPPMDASTYDLGKASRECRKALQMLENEPTLAELQEQVKALMARIELAEDPVKRFIFKGHMVTGKGVLLRIYDGLDGQTHSISLGDTLYGYKFQSLSSDSKELEVSKRGDTFTLEHE